MKSFHCALSDHPISGQVLELLSALSEVGEGEERERGGGGERGEGGERGGGGGERGGEKRKRERERNMFFLVPYCRHVHNKLIC